MKHFEKTIPNNRCNNPNQMGQNFCKNEQNNCMFTVCYIPKQLHDYSADVAKWQLAEIART